MRMITVALLVLMAGCSTMTTNTAKLGERVAAVEARVDLLEQDARSKP